MGSDNESVSTLASESSVSEQTSRARQALLHKRLHDQLDVKDRVVQELTANVNELQQQLTKSETLLSAHSVPLTAELHSASETQVINHVIIK